MLHVHTRWVDPRDMPEILAIDAEACTGEAWNIEDFNIVLKRRTSHLMVAEYSDKVIGFMLYKQKRQSVRLLNFAVDKEYRRRRVGTQLIDKLVSRYRVVAFVRDSNLITHLFLQSCGFLAIATLRSYFSDTGEDAYRMEFEP